MEWELEFERIQRKEVVDFDEIKEKRTKKKYHFARTRRSDASFHIEGFWYTFYYKKIMVKEPNQLADERTCSIACQRCYHK